jgi:pimeloyl-ACP methyl ester carboxylesterase
LLRKALPPKVLDSDQAAEFASRFPDLVAQLGLDDEAIRELAGGVRDVFVAACADPLSGLHGPAGKPCPARPWVCLLCPLAVFAPRHLPNLMRLNAYFNRQFLAMPTRQFLAVFGPYAQRIEAILDIFADHDAAKTPTPRWA